MDLSSRKILIIFIILGIVIIVGGYAAYLYLHPSNRPAWLFKGAYAKYYGETQYMFMTVRGTFYMEILDLNSTHYKTLYYVRIESQVGVYENQTVVWKRIDEPIKNVVRQYETTIYLDTLDITRDAIVYEIKDGTIVYYDKKTEIPLEITYNMGDYTLTVKLVDTNIPLD